MLRPGPEARRDEATLVRGVGPERALLLIGAGAIGVYPVTVTATNAAGSDAVSFLTAPIHPNVTRVN